jgi:hypothetical protein
MKRDLEVSGTEVTVNKNFPRFASGSPTFSNSGVFRLGRKTLLLFREKNSKQPWKSGVQALGLLRYNLLIPSH